MQIGRIAIALTTEDANEAAKILFDFAKDAPGLRVKGAYIGNELYDAAKIEAFSKLPGRMQLLSMIASTINAPVQKLAATLLAYVEKKQAEEASGASAASSEKAEKASGATAEEAPKAEAAPSQAEVKDEKAAPSDVVPEKPIVT